MNKELITKQGFEKIKNKIKFIKEIEMPENIKNLEIAASYGDLRENAEYEAETDKQAFLRNRLSELNSLLHNSVVIDPSKKEHNQIIFGSTFKIINIEDDTELTYTLVGGYESDPSKNKISYNSPFAKLFINKKVGDEIETNFNNKKNIYEIIDIYFDEERIK